MTDSPATSRPTPATAFPRQNPDVPRHVPKTRKGRRELVQSMTWTQEELQTMRAAVFVIAHKVPRAAFLTLWHSAGSFLFAELTDRYRPTRTNTTQGDADSVATNTKEA